MDLLNGRRAFRRFHLSVPVLFRWREGEEHHEIGCCANIGLPAPGVKRTVTYSPGMSPTQVHAYHRRQRARGRVPGRATQRRQRESEAQAEWESSEPNYGTSYGLPRR